MIDQATIAVNRFGLGGRPGEIAAVGGLPADYLLAQLDRAPRVSGPELPDTAEAITAFREFRRQRRKELASGDTGKTGTMMSSNSPRRIYNAEVRARIQTFVETDTPFAERLCLFWANHFAVSAASPPIAAMAGAFEREAIRPHITGNFADMVLASTANPGMLLYLDNANSIGPNSRAGRRRNRGLNENLARELLELHTLGVDGGYDLDDIRELAMAITGWSLAGPKTTRARMGTFVFRRGAHEPGTRNVMGESYRNTGSVAQGQRVLNDLAQHPSTARHIAFKLAQHFIADAPDRDLVATMERAYLQNRGELMPVYTAMLSHPTAFRPAPMKFKTPVDYMASVARGLQVDRNYQFWSRGLVVMGQRLWGPPSPKGWPDTRKRWVSSDALKTRLDFAVAVGRKMRTNFDVQQRATDMLGASLDRDTEIAISRAADQSQALALLLMSPEFQKR
ncbi:MAG: DUF1800 domain-containing protein [Rhizobiaceae bacterium]